MHTEASIIMENRDVVTLGLSLSEVREGGHIVGVLTEGNLDEHGNFIYEACCTCGATQSGTDYQAVWAWAVGHMRTGV